MAIINSSLFQDVLLFISTDVGNNLYRQARREFSRAVLLAHQQVMRTFGESGSSIKSRTGHLRRSINGTVEGNNLNLLKGKLASASVYAPIHEYGGTIRGKDKYMHVTGVPLLNIPLDANKTPSGQMRFNAREVFDQGGYIVKRQGRHPLVMIDGVPMFVLVESVYIRARLGMRDAMAEATPALIEGLSNIRLQRALRG